MNKTIWIIIIMIIAVVVGSYFIWKKYSSNQADQTTSPATTATTQTTATFDGHYIDTHAHLISDRFSIDEAADIIKNAKIDKMIIMQTPVDLSRIATPESHGIPQAQEKYPDLFYLMFQDEPLVMLHQAVKNNNFPASEEEQFKKLSEDAAKSDQYVGFGELALRHFPQPTIKDPQQKEARDITISGDNPWILDLADIGAKYNMPLDVHIEPDSTTVPGFESLIKHNSQAKIIFDHAGWYNTGEATPELFDKLLGKYANLYSSIKLRKPANEAQAKVAILDENGQIKSEWLAVLNKYPDRFMIGTDVKFGLKTSEGDYQEIFNLTDRFLQALPASLAQKIATENAKKVFNFSKK